jgi:hypothetical protein
MQMDRMVFERALYVETLILVIKQKMVIERCSMSLLHYSYNNFYVSSAVLPLHNPASSPPTVFCVSCITVSLTTTTFEIQDILK